MLLIFSGFWYHKMARLEYKYLMMNKQIDMLRSLMAPYVELDKYSAKMPDNKYTVRSIYYDTSRLDFYQEKLAGIKKRKKVRIRGYNEAEDNSLNFLEVKKKNGPTIIKTRASVKFKNLETLLTEKNIERYVINGNGAMHHIEDASQFFYYLKRFCLTPTIKVMYEREAYFYKFNQDLRITFDTNLRSSMNTDLDCLYEEDGLTYAKAGKAILEVKLGGEIPGWLSDIIARLKLNLQALSKYTTCIESHSKYERQLRRSLHGLAKFNEFKYYPKSERSKNQC